jgi:hypothetical protein
MSGYFGALQRSIGMTPAAAMATSAAAKPDAFTASISEIEATSPPVGFEPAPATGVPSTAGRTLTPSDQVRVALPAPRAYPAVDEGLHPVVRAALRWVQADPAVAGSAHPSMPASAVEPALRRSAASRSPATPDAVAAGSARAREERPATGSNARRAQQRESAALASWAPESPRAATSAPTASTPQPTRDIQAAAAWSMADDRAPRPGSAQVAAPLPAVAAAGAAVEVRIGSIQLRIDPPAAPRAAAPLPAAQPARAAPPQPAPRSAYARGRVPRL